jgi:hypothetical protein
MIIIPALAAVTLLTIITLLVDMPEQQQQQQQQRTAGNTNTAVQLISATLSYYNDNPDADGNPQWPPDLADSLQAYLPIAPQNIDEMASISIDGTSARILINMQTNANASQLVRQLSKLDIDIVDADGNRDDQGIWVMVELDAQRYGQWDFNNQQWSACVNGRAQQTAIDCTQNGRAHQWCLGSSVKIADCQRTTYGNCINGNQTRTCSPGIRDGRYQDCPNPNTPVPVSCWYPQWLDRGWTSWSREYWEGIWLRKKRHRIYQCSTGRMNEEAVYCSLDNRPYQFEVCTKILFWWEDKCR